MGKNSVRSMTLVCLIAAVAMIGAMASTTTAQSPDPSELPRLELSDVSYIGGFRLPATSANGDDFSFGGRQLALNPAGPSLFVGSRAGRLAEVTIPVPARSSNPNALPFATFLQPFADPTEGRLSQVASDGVALDGLMVHGNRLYGTASVYYDANNTQRVSHYSRSLQLNEPSFQGWSQVWEAGKAGFVSGVMAVVPEEWRARLGGAAVTGQCCIPIVGRTSWGPAAFAFDPTQVGQAVVGAAPLLYYTGVHPTLGSWDASNPIYGATMTLGGLTIIPGTRTALYFGANGIGPNCYGNGTGQESLHGTKGPDGSTWCYDPTTSDKGSHAYPYHYQMWAYDLNDFAAVKAGLKQPWEVVPYGVWPFELPTPEARVRLGGVAYDAARQTLYISQLYADPDGYASRPVIHALHVDVPARAVETPAASSVTITSNLAAPQIAGTEIRFRATAAGGADTYQYQWSTYDGAAWLPLSDWTSSQELTLAPAEANPQFRVGVGVRSAGHTTELAEASTTIEFPIAGRLVSSVSLTANKAAPQPANTPIVWTATPTGGEAPHQYQWWVYNGSTWQAIGGFSAANTFMWTPDASANYRVAVWVRGAGNSGAHEAATEAWFAITGGAAPAPTAVATAVSLTANRTSPQPAHTTITWTAAPVGGVAPHLFQWWVFDGVTWVSQPWSTAGSFAWTPTVANASYRVAVWVRSAGNAGSHETATEAWFTIAGGTARTTAVALTTNLPAPQRPNTTVTWTAVPTGGVGPHEYQWWVFDGVTWVSQPWSTQNTFAWTPTVANARYRVAVWVRSAGNSIDHESSTEGWFAISANLGQ